MPFLVLIHVLAQLLLTITCRHLTRLEPAPYTQRDVHVPYYARDAVNSASRLDLHNMPLMPVDVVISRAQFKLTNAATPPAERTAPPRRRYRPGCVWGPAGPPLFLKVLLYRRGENVFVSTHIVLHNSNACFKMFLSRPILCSITPMPAS